MTRYPPQGPPPSGGFQSGDPYGHQQPQYNQSEPNYGAYNSGEGQAYGQAPGYQQTQEYGGEAPGSAQSYYGSNQQAYQQYPAEHYSGYNEQQYQTGPPPGVPHQQSPHMQSPAPPSYGGQQSPQMQSPPTYAGQQYPTQQYPPYAQQYPSQPLAYGGQSGDGVAAFRTHFDQPHGPIDPATAGQQALPPGATDEGEDRGIMGAVAGGAAGAYGGHKVNHGILGGIGGAVAGSMLEDAYKKHNKPEKEKKQKQRRGSHSSSSSSDSSDSEKHHHHHHHESRDAPIVVVAGNFHASSRDIRLEGPRCTLVAECADTQGHFRSSNLDLNDCFTNSNGRLCWARGGNFASSARHIRLADGGNALEAELGDGRGGWQYNKVWLNERITNEDGRLAML
ncbi:hypothetical protein LTR36_003566 [Oleoguttula mirabilis]|uniref:Cyanovirin-N domain-containing protein n=1 Tax=Oleoguttula mirabilis TaxID=1507867 RepID=A0AAV9JI23_9PEZI|nr:hypothetical protein LTR36_003566 [Oleoguttula mirabilis]